MNNKFIVNMKCSFQDFNYLYLVMDLLSGGDLRYHLDNAINNGVSFEEKQIKFIISNLILATEYIHSKQIIHCDIKPENIIFDKKGYAHITDFGIARPSTEVTKSEFNGTPGYMAPELLFCQSYSFPVDFYAIGMVTYELMYKERPYKNTTIDELREEIFEVNIKISKRDLILNHYSNEMADFVYMLLKRNECKRLGYLNGVQELKEHKWFKDVDWKLLSKQTEKSPFYDIIEQCGKGEIFDKTYCEEKNPIGAETHKRYQSILNNVNYIKIFENYTCICFPEDKPLYLQSQDISGWNYNISSKENGGSRNSNFLQSNSNLSMLVQLQRKSILSMRESVKEFHKNQGRTYFDKESKDNSMIRSNSRSKVVNLELSRDNSQSKQKINSSNKLSPIRKKKLKLPKLFHMKVLDINDKSSFRIKHLRFIPAQATNLDSINLSTIVKSKSQKNIFPIKNSIFY